MRLDIFDAVKRVVFRKGRTKGATLADLMRQTRYDTDKDDGYLENYEEFFGPIRDKNIKLLELGINTGGSLLLWRDYFTRGVIAGLDSAPVTLDDATGRVHTYQGLQQDCELLDRIAREIAPDGFDIVIDDASHIAEFSRISFGHIFLHHLRPGGIYVIEDWGTGYWESWPDGKKFQATSAGLIDDAAGSGCRSSATGEYTNHSYGMVGLIKELVDECGMGDITKPELGIPPPRESRIKKIQVSHGQVFILKG
jgi:SAM-dependent methyltransferase